MIETPRNDHTPEQPAHPDRLDRVPQVRLLNEVLLHVSAQLRTALGGMHIAVSRLAPPERRDADAALDRDAALLNRNYYALLRLSNNLSNAPMLLDDAPLTRENTDIVTWLDGLCRQAAPLFALRNVALTFQCSAAHHGAAINRVCLEQAVWNLLSNALKFTAEGGAVTVSLRFERRQVLLAVTDTGCGINAESRRVTAGGWCWTAGRGMAPPSRWRCRTSWRKMWWRMYPSITPAASSRRWWGWRTACPLRHSCKSTPTSKTPLSGGQIRHGRRNGSQRSRLSRPVRGRRFLQLYSGRILPRYTYNIPLTYHLFYGFLRGA